MERQIKLNHEETKNTKNTKNTKKGPEKTFAPFVSSWLILWGEL